MDHFFQGVDNTGRVEPHGENHATFFMQADVHLIPVLAKRVDKNLEELIYYDS